MKLSKTLGNTLKAGVSANLCDRSRLELGLLFELASKASVLAGGRGYLPQQLSFQLRNTNGNPDELNADPDEPFF